MHPNRLFISLIIAIIYSCSVGCNHKTPQPVKTSTPCNASYAKDINPLVNNKCAVSGCHGNNGLVNLSVYNELKAKVDNGKVKKYVLELKTMPPSGATQLTDDEKNKLQCWLDNGAPQN